MTPKESLPYIIPTTGFYPAENGRGDGCHPCDYTTERGSPAGLEEGSHYVMGESKRGPHARVWEAAPSWQPARKWGSWTYNHKKLDSADNTVHLEEDPEIQKEMQPTDALFTDLWYPQSRTSLSYIQISDPQKLWDTQYIVLSLWICRHLLCSNRKWTHTACVIMQLDKLDLTRLDNTGVIKKQTS